METFEAFPKEGDRFDYAGWTFTVLSMDGRRVEKVLAEKIEKEESNS